MIIALAIAAFVQLIPLVGVSGAPALQRLYGVELTDPKVVLLLRQRAVLLALVGVALIAAIFVPEWRAPAIALGLLSKLSFLLIVATSKPNALIARVAKVDAVTAVLLVVAAVLMR
jgi:hypothetical protein